MERNNIPLPGLFRCFTALELAFSFGWTAVYSKSVSLDKTFSTLCADMALCLMCLSFVLLQLSLISEYFLAVVTGIAKK